MFERTTQEILVERTFEETELTKMVREALEITSDACFELGNPELGRKYRDLLTRILKEKLDVSLYPRD